ncbi:MAG TPA: CsbD family protein [Terracidiphilus sp.]|nr:CsbD family protein [Terracidiphilus sp.]
MMKPSTDDKTTGTLHEVKGAIKQNAGELTKKPNLEADGRAEKNAGKDQKTVGKIEKAVGV